MFISLLLCILSPSSLFKILNINMEEMQNGRGRNTKIEELNKGKTNKATLQYYYLTFD